MMWAHVASGKVASKRGGISFNLVPFFSYFFLERLCMHDQRGSSLSLSTPETFNLPVDPRMEVLPTHSDTTSPTRD